jgi:hypothetical protein
MKGMYRMSIPYIFCAMYQLQHTATVGTYYGIMFTDSQEYVIGAITLEVKNKYPHAIVLSVSVTPVNNSVLDQIETFCKLRRILNNE